MQNLVEDIMKTECLATIIYYALYLGDDHTIPDSFLRRLKTIPDIVCYTAVFCVVTQRSSPGALRDDTKNGCLADYTGSSFCSYIRTVISARFPDVRERSYALPI